MPFTVSKAGAGASAQNHRAPLENDGAPRTTILKPKQERKENNNYNKILPNTQRREKWEGKRKRENTVSLVHHNWPSKH